MISLYVESKQVKYIESESRTVVTGVGRWGKYGDVGEGVQGGICVE